MTKRLLALAVTAAAATLSAPAIAAPLNQGDLFVYRVGTGATGLSSAATAVFIDEYNTAGTLVQSIALPTVTAGANGMLTASGTATSEGLLTFSADNSFLMLTGYNAGTGTSSIGGTSSSAVARTVGAINVATGTINTTTKLSDASSGNNIRGVASTDGNSIWVSGGAGGVRYTTLGSSTSTQLSTTVANIRGVEVANGQLYVSASSGSTVRLGTVGAGEPTTNGQVITNLPGFAASTGSPYAFYFADLSGGVAGVDTLYVADDTAGITKYSLANGTWTAKGTIGTTSDAYRGLTGYTDATGVHLFATGKGGSGAAGGGKLVSLTDTAGYDGTFSATATTLASATTNTAFRGVAYLAVSSVPEPETYALMLAGLAAVGFLARRRSA